MPYSRTGSGPPVRSMADLVKKLASLAYRLLSVVCVDFEIDNILGTMSRQSFCIAPIFVSD